MWKKEDNPQPQPYLVLRKSLAKVVYNTDLAIKDPAEVASLCIFYDQVLLPYTSIESSLHLMRVDKNGREIEVDAEASNDIANWNEKYRELFTGGALRRLSEGPKLQFQVKEDDEDFETIRLWEGADSLQSFQPGDTVVERGLGLYCIRTTETRYGVVKEHEKRPYIDVRRKKPNRPKRTIEFKSDDLKTLKNVRHYKRGSRNKGYVRTDLVRHILRGDIAFPQIFASRDWRSKRELLVALEAQATFEYLIPKISVTSPDQILTLRDVVKDTRAGFAEHLLSLSEGVEQRLRAKSSHKEILDFARDVVYRKLRKDYEQYCLQLNSIKAGTYKRVGEVLQRAFAMHGTIASPLFWMQVIAELGLLSLAGVSEQEKFKSFEYKAYQFMSQVESGYAKISKAG